MRDYADAIAKNNFDDYQNTIAIFEANFNRIGIHRAKFDGNKFDVCRIKDIINQKTGITHMVEKEKIRPGEIFDYDTAVSGPYSFIIDAINKTVSIDNFGPRKSIEDDDKAHVNRATLKGYDTEWQTENCQKMLKAIDAIAGCGLEAFMRDMSELNDTYSAERLTLIHVWNANMQHVWETFIREMRDMFTQRLLSLKARGVNLDMHQNDE